MIRLWDGEEGVHKVCRIFNKILLQSTIEANGPLVSVFSLDGISTTIVGLEDSIVLAREINLLCMSMNSKCNMEREECILWLRL